MKHIHGDNIDRALPSGWSVAEHLPTRCLFRALDCPANVETSVGTVAARAGDVILRDEHGIWVLTQEMFYRAYIRPLNAAGASGPRTSG